MKLFWRLIAIQVLFTFAFALLIGAGVNYRALVPLARTGQIQAVSEANQRTNRRGAIIRPNLSRKQLQTSRQNHEPL